MGFIKTIFWAVVVGLFLGAVFMPLVHLIVGM